MSPAEELRAAAATLRGLSARVPSGRLTLHEDLIESGGSAESAVLTDSRDGMDALVLSGEWSGEELALIRLLVAVRGAVEPLAAWLESWNGIESFCEDGPMDEDFRHALKVARAVNASAPAPTREETNR
jgi:hypothetical protein